MLFQALDSQDMPEPYLMGCPAGETGGYAREKERLFLDKRLVREQYISMRSGAIRQAVRLRNPRSRSASPGWTLTLPRLSYR